MPIKSFRGQLTDGAQEEINLRTNTGKIGYRIHKFEIMTNAPYAGDSAEHIVKIYINKQGTIDGLVNFEDLDLIGVAIANNHTSGYQDPTIPVIIFENMVFNQNVFVTGVDIQGSQAVNYYIELEQIKLNDNESTMATLQSIRNRYESYTPAGPS